MMTATGAMKLKQQPEDFYVEEITDVTPGPDGPFALYRLEKRSWTTPDAAAAIRRRWNLPPSRLSYGGLKDRHAHTIQFLSIFHGPRRNLTHHTVRLDYLGQIPHSYTSDAIRANRFQLTLRDMSTSDASAADLELEKIREYGVPNYFDDQRFGSAGTGEFVARLVIAHRYEDALRTALAAPYEFDRAEQKKEKDILRTLWGDWPNCKAQLPRGHARSIIDYLIHHPTDFRGAVARLRPDLRGLYMSAYQSHLWNRMLALWLSEHCQPQQLGRLRLRLGTVPVYRDLDEEQQETLANLRLPLPSARVRLDSADPRQALMERVLAEEGIKQEQMKLKGSLGMFFSKGDRAALCVPADLRSKQSPDEKHSGRVKLVLSFELPRGCYATMIVKRATAAEFD
jgi:tRNA pseudouridine13 synthase